jgi:hypothetical protein
MPGGHDWALRAFGSWRIDSARGWISAITQEAEQELEHVDEIRYRFSAPMMATFSTGRARHMRVGFLQALRVS